MGPITRHKAVVLLGMLSMLVSGGGACTRSPDARNAQDGVVARVGDYSITRRDIALRDQVIALMYPAERKSYALRQLIDAYTSAQILVNNGQAITPATLAAEEKRIDQNTKLPELLGKIKAVFGDDHDAYRRLYVLPTYAQRMIYFGFFLSDPRAQTQSLAKARATLARVQRDPLKLAQIADQGGGHFHRLEISASTGIRDPNADLAQMPGQMPEAMRQQVQAQKSEDAKRWIDQIIGGLKAGQTYPKIIDSGEYWTVARLVRPLGSGRYSVETIDIAKDNYEKWREAEKARVKIESSEAY